jgi:RHS repeat-associated protein
MTASGTVQFTGKERDAETGLDYFGARYYSGAQGRFTTPDEFTGGPFEVGGSRPSQPGPLPYADIMNPQSLNKYVYALNNPLRYIDPDGHEVVLAGSAQDQEEEKKRILANVRKNERALFTTVTGKDGKTRLTLDKDAVANFDGKHSQGYSMLVQTVESRKTATVVMDNKDSRTTFGDGGNATVFLNRNIAAIDRIAPMRDRQGNLVPNPFGIIAGHELLGHARLYMLGIVPAAYYDGSGSRTFQIENLLRREQGLPPRPDEVP